MSDVPRIWTIIDLVKEHCGSPSLRHIRDPEQIRKLAVKILDGSRDPWRKWPPARDKLVRAAVGCWIPVGDLHAALAEFPGPPLTRSDVAGRLLVLREEGLDRLDDSLRAGCEALYAGEKAAGTELAAIIQLMNDWMGEEIGRMMRQERVERDRRRAELQELAEQTFLSGADCKWTKVGSSADLYCRVNGRTYRLFRTSDKKLEVWRVQSTDDPAGRLIGRYQGRSDATNAVGTGRLSIRTASVDTKGVHRGPPWALTVMRFMRRHTPQRRRQRVVAR